jgi:hypothetical protein
MAGVVRLGELMMILELHRQCLQLSDLVLQRGLDCKTVAKRIACGLVPPVYFPRSREIDRFKPCQRARLPAIRARRRCAFGAS